MEIVLIRPAKTPKTAWKSECGCVRDTKDGMDFSAKVVHINSGKASHRFEIHFTPPQHVHVSSEGYRYDGTVEKNDGTPKDIVAKCLKVPILAAVMYRVSCSPFNSARRMNRHMGSNIFSRKDGDIDGED